MGMMGKQEATVFQSAGHAVHVAFLVMAQQAMQDAPLRKALIRAMETAHLDMEQTDWLDQLRGKAGSAVNFEGLSGGDVRAQCAIITEAVATALPDLEKWVLQAKYGETEFEDVGNQDESARIALDGAVSDVRVLRERLTAARAELDVIAGAAGMTAEYRVARTSVRELADDLYAAESIAEAAKVAFEKGRASGLIDNGRVVGPGGAPCRRFAFSRQRIAAITSLSTYFAPLFPRIKPLALDFMLGRMFANHKKVDISARDLAERFGGSHSTYVRAAWKIKNHVRQLEDMAIERLTPLFAKQGVIPPEN